MNNILVLVVFVSKFSPVRVCGLTLGVFDVKTLENHC